MSGLFHDDVPDGPELPLPAEFLDFTVRSRSAGEVRDEVSGDAGVDVDEFEDSSAAFVGSEAGWLGHGGLQYSGRFRISASAWEAFFSANPGKIHRPGTGGTLSNG